MADDRDRDEAAGGEPPAHYAYPSELSAAVLDALRRRGDGVVASPLLEPARLDALLSTAYQASLLRDEGRQVIFRLLVAPPETLAADGGPPTGLHLLQFPERRRCDVPELRRLAAAAPYHRALIGACVNAAGEPALWGIVHAGARWLRVQTGGRLPAPALPRALVVSVGGPGRLEVELGDEVLARLEAGRIGGTTIDVFGSQWLSQRFAPVRAELLAQHAAKRAAAKASWAPLDESLIRGIGQHMVRQLIAVIRSARHGATIVVVPPEAESALLTPTSLLRVHYRLADGEPRRRYRTLILRIMNRLAAQHAGPLAEAVGWTEYQHSTDLDIAAADEALFEVAHLMAGFAAVDGAVLMTRTFEMLGFGAEIAGNLPDVPVVMRAEDVEGTVRRPESTERVGTRHRSAYRLCQAMPEALAIIVSQDGGVRFACWQNDAVTYWHYLSGHLLAA